MVGNQLKPMTDDRRSGSPDKTPFGQDAKPRGSTSWETFFETVVNMGELDASGCGADENVAGHQEATPPSIEQANNNNNSEAGTIYSP